VTGIRGPRFFATQIDWSRGWFSQHRAAQFQVLYLVLFVKGVCDYCAVCTRLSGDRGARKFKDPTRGKRRSKSGEKFAKTTHLVKNFFALATQVSKHPGSPTSKAICIFPFLIPSPKPALSCVLSHPSCQKLVDELLSNYKDPSLINAVTHVCCHAISYLLWRTCSIG
jgi:hypothetical protein